MLATGSAPSRRMSSDWVTGAAGDGELIAVDHDPNRDAIELGHRSGDFLLGSDRFRAGKERGIGQRRK